MNNYNWTKYVSSWIRGVFVVSKKSANSTIEVSPLRANFSLGKVDMSLNPAYAIYNDYKTGKTTQGMNTIFQATYSLSPKDKFFLEVKYALEPAENFFDARLRKAEDGTSYMISYMRNF